jgi:purine-binding chemotaxis protein CheW
MSERSGKRGGGRRVAGAQTPRGGAADLSAPVTPTEPDDRVLLFADSLQDERVEAEGERHEWENWVTCRVDREVFALPVRQVQEILRVPALTRVPHAPFPVRGVTNLRGYVLPVVDLRLRLGLPPVEVGDRARIMVVQSRGRLIGLLVDAVEQVAPIDRLAIEPPPEDVMTDQSYYLIGVYHGSENELIILLDADRVLQVKD